MEENKPENPFAFPLTDGRSFATDGMTLRDYFAAKAMQGMLASGTNWIEMYKENTRFAYKIADAMLTQRNKEQDQ